MANQTFTFAVSETENGARVDQALVKFLHDKIQGGVSRAQIQRLVERGLVKKNGAAEERPGCRLKAGDMLEVVWEAEERAEIIPQDIALSILYEDDDLLCVNKPPGLTVHPGAGRRDGTLLNALAHYLRGDSAASFSIRPWIVHRLDKDTSGVLIIAKNETVQRALSAQFQERVVEKEYRALVLATPRLKNVHVAQDSGIIDAPIARHTTQRTRMGVNHERGRAARTRWHVLERFEYGALLAIQIETGRTHQIRVHFESVGAPVIGDTVYGVFQALPKPLLRLHERFGRQALHSASLTVTHPISGKRLTVEAPLPADMLQLIEQWRSYHG